MKGVDYMKKKQPREPKILFVDDMEEVFRKIRFPQGIDYARSLEMARYMLYSKRYDLVITDYHLGKEKPKGGLDVIKIARGMGLDAVLISRDNHEKEALEAGAKKFIFKKEFLEKWTGLNQTNLINLID